MRLWLRLLCGPNCSIRPDRPYYIRTLKVTTTLSAQLLSFLKYYGTSGHPNLSSNSDRRRETSSISYSERIHVFPTSARNVVKLKALFIHKLLFSISFSNFIVLCISENLIISLSLIFASISWAYLTTLECLQIIAPYYYPCLSVVVWCCECYYHPL